MSKIRQGVRDYLALRRSLGFKLSRQDNTLNDFVSFLERRKLPYIITREVVKWAKKPQNALPQYWARRISIVRGFAKYWVAEDPRTEIPPLRIFPHRYKRRTPYIYPDEQICRLIEAGKRLPSKQGLRGRTYSTLLGLVAVAGLRVMEAVDLDDDDVDLKKGVLTIRRTKFGKTRLIPVHPSTQQKLQEYVSHRKTLHPRPKTPALFVTERATRVTQWTVRSTFIKLSKQIGIRGKTDSHGPRIHDLRHTLAVRTIIDWYRRGLNVEEQMQKLSTYLGHTHVADTYWYLSAVPELLSLARARLERSKGGSR